MKLLHRAAALAAALIMCAAPAGAEIKATGDTSAATNFTSLMVIDPATGKSVFGANAYTMTTVSVTANTWTLAASASSTRKRLIIGERSSLSCSWSFNASPATGEGFPFSTSSSGGSWVFDDPISTNAVYVLCSTTGVVSVAGA
jgi:hypothetical protein